MKRHFEDLGHTRTRQVTCECGRKFRCGTSGDYYLHRYDDYLLLTFVNYAFTIQNWTEC